MTGRELQDRIGRLRTTQAEVARRCDWTRAYICQLCGYAEIPTMIATKLDATLDEIETELLKGLAGVPAATR